MIFQKITGLIAKNAENWRLHNDLCLSCINHQNIKWQKIIGVNMKITERAKYLAEKTSGSYSFDRYRNWNAVVQMLINKGYTNDEIEAILMSKWTRWACDRDTRKGVRYGYHTSKALERFMEDIPRYEVEMLMHGF
jgi:hypothetical protein